MRTFIPVLLIAFIGLILCQSPIDERCKSFSQAKPIVESLQGKIDESVKTATDKATLATMFTKMYEASTAKPHFAQFFYLVFATIKDTNAHFNLR